MKLLTPIEVVEKIRIAIETRNIEALCDLCDDNCLIEIPFALDANKSKYEGIDKIREVYTALSPMFKMLELHKVSVVVNESKDSEVIIAEFTNEGKSLVTGELFNYTSSIGVIRVRHGKIIHYRDYPNVLRSAKLTGMMQQFAASLAK